jgi:MFS superfamily sulfate permease-like transporter
MGNNHLNQIADTLTKKPEYGIISSMLSISMSATEFLQLLGVIIGLFIAIITAVLKIMELRDRMEKRRSKLDSDGEKSDGD